LLSFRRHIFINRHGSVVIAWEIFGALGLVLMS
jgi:hypothetical protein